MSDILDNMQTIRGDENASLNKDKSLGNLVTSRGTVAMIPPVVDQFELGMKLGEGGFGSVYLARDTVGDRKVALKVLPPLLTSDPHELDNVRDNFKLVSALHHQHIASLLHLHQIRDVSNSAKELLKVDSGGFLVVMEYVEGLTLSRWRKGYEGRKVPLDRAIAVCKQVALALDFAHRQKVIHRDIKPSNIMLSSSEAAKVLDFGLAAEIRSSMSRVSVEGGNTSTYFGATTYTAADITFGIPNNSYLATGFVWVQRASSVDGYTYIVTLDMFI